MHLPSPPSLGEKLGYLKTNRFKLYGASLLSTIPLVYGMVAFSIMEPILYWYFPFALLIAVYLTISLVIGLLGKDFSWNDHKGRWNHEFFPSVDVYIPTCGEEPELLDNTFRYAREIDYRGIVRIHVLDDSGRDIVRYLAEKYRHNYICRPDRPRMKKAGNLRHAFPLTKGDLILILDADFAARPDILEEMVPYFKSWKLGILQTPQFFDVKEGMSWVEAGAGYVQELFYRLIQVSRNTWGASVCVGSCAMYRRSALESFGGTAEIGYSEDVHTGWNVMTQGWQVRYLPMPLAKGVCPSDASSFFSQQYRWAMGSMTLMLNPKFWKSPITLMQKVCYLSGMGYYLATALAIFLAPIPVLALLFFMPEKIHFFSAIFAVPSFLYGMLAIGLWTNAEWGFHYFRIRALQPWAHLFAIVDKIMGSAVPWMPTNAQVGFPRFRLYQVLVSIWCLGIGSAFAIGAIPKIQAGDFGWVPSGCLIALHLGISLSAIKK